ncbi:hypothetical protein NPIL_525881 [Nephila pilipes]|uniref:Uncharacterized protein n=1 Tax=Nephila pilipes TaxID=299642 RepID=A0A8X6Q077_NEPPI|nr:hypothetical protein NPIL_525881 [Nephila pilipes]
MPHRLQAVTFSIPAHNSSCFEFHIFANCTRIIAAIEISSSYTYFNQKHIFKEGRGWIGKNESLCAITLYLTYGLQTVLNNTRKFSIAHLVMESKSGMDFFPIYRLKKEKFA